MIFLILTAAWLTFVGFWIAAIFIFKPSEPRRRDKRWFLFVSGASVITVILEYPAAPYFFKSFEFPLPLNDLSAPLGIALLLSGLSFAVWGRIALGRLWSGSVALIGKQPIVKNGHYAFVRHPIYTGVIAMLWGSFLLERIGVVLFVAVLATVFLFCKAMLEEALLLKHNSNEYLDYKKEVNGMFFKQFS